MEQQQPNMMGNGMPPQNMMMSSMQRPQSGNIEQQMHAKIMDDLRQKMGSIPSGWQTTFDIGQRASRIMQLVTGLRMLHQEPMKCVQIAENFEERTLQESPNKEVYTERMSKKMAEIHQRRAQAAAAMRANQMGMPMNNNNMGMPQNGMGMNTMQNVGMGGGMNMNNMGMNLNMGNNGIGMGMPNQMGGNAGQQNPNFPAQLQRQMQPSPIPPQQNQQPQNNTLDPSALQNPQMPQQMMQQQQMMNMNQSMPQQTPRPNQLQNRNMNGQAQIPGGPTQQEVISQAQRAFNGLPEERKTQLRNSFLASLNDQQRAEAQKGGDPLFKFLMAKSKEALIKQRQQALMNSGAGQNGGATQMGNNMGMNNAQQTPVSQAGAPNFDFSSIMGQQQNAIKSQESGEQVVPASNNPMGLGGQMNMSQGVNPQQLLANQNNQGGNNANQMQFLAMQQQRMQQEKQRQMAQSQMQQQAMAQQQAQNQNQLRGQPGGLNTPNALNGGQVNSPAMNMNMLNRPMAPPGQTTPSTPQPNRAQQGMPPTPVNPANQLVQHHQSMVNQNNVQMSQGGQGQTLQQQIMTAKFAPGIKEKLINLPPHQQNAILMKIRNNPQNYAAFMHGLQNGMPIPQLGMGMENQQMGNQQQMMPGMPPNMSTAVPAFNSQPPPNQEQGQQGANGQAAFSQAQKMQQHQITMKQRAMDEGEYAKPAPQNLGIQLPAEARTWGDIKRHIQQHQSVMPPNLLDKLHQLQSQWYNAHPEEVHKALTAFQEKVRGNQQAMQMQQVMQQQQQGPPSARPPSAQPGPNGQAPPAQMVPPNAQMQQQGNQNAGIPNLNQMQIKTPAAEEIMMFRQRIPNAQNMTDDQIRAIMMRRLQQQRAQQMQQMQQQQQQQNMLRAQALANGGQPPGAQQPQPQQAPQLAQQPQAPKQQTTVQGQKRQQSGNDDVMEIPNPNQQQQMNAPQRPGMQPNQQMPKGMPVKIPTQADLDKMDPQNKLLTQQKMKQMEALRKVQGITNNTGATAPQQQQVQPQQPSTLPQQQQQQAQAQQGGAQGLPPEIRQLDDRIKALWHDVQRTTPKGPPIQLDSEGLEQVRNSLKRLWQPHLNLDRTFYPALRAPQLGEERVKQAMRAKIIVQQNAADKDGNAKGYLAVSPMELKKHEVFIGQYFTALKELKARQDAARAQQAAGATQAQQPPAQPAAQPAKPAAPPAPERKPSQQSNARKQSAANKAPPAPTDNTKRFDWGAQSPQGVPKYDPTHSQLTQEKLKLPPQKKRRTAQQPESAESTPAAQITTPQPAASSPNVAGAKAQAAEQAKKMQVQAKVEASRFKCDDSMCEGSIRGFETQEMLKQHKETVHKPVEDPFKFLEEALTTGEISLEVEKPAAAPKTAAQPRGKPMPPAAGIKKEGQTPDIKTEIGTPARPGSSFGKVAVNPTPTPGKKGADAKAPDSAIEVASAEKEKTLLESMAAKISFDLPVCEAAQPIEAPLDVTDELFDELFMNGATAADGNIFISDWNDLGDVSSITDWGLRPSPDPSPDLTPSDGTSQSSRESDISQSERLRINLEWDAFGNGDTGVPDVMMQTLGLSEGEGEKKDGDKKGDEWNWRGDMMDWESLFGANAGLEGDSMGEGMVF